MSAGRRLLGTRGQDCYTGVYIVKKTSAVEICSGLFIVSEIHCDALCEHDELVGQGEDPGGGINHWFRARRENDADFVLRARKDTSGFSQHVFKMVGSDPALGVLKRQRFSVDGAPAGIVVPSVLVRVGVEKDVDSVSCNAQFLRDLSGFEEWLSRQELVDNVFHVGC